MMMASFITHSKNALRVYEDDREESGLLDE